MSNSLRHRERRRQRAKDRQKENRIYRNAGRCLHFMTKEVPKETIWAERRKQKTLWQKAKEYIKRVISRVIPRSRGN